MAYIPVLTVTAVLAFTAGCRQQKAAHGPDAVLRKLYDEYKFGQIEKCEWRKSVVYHAGINAFDAGSQVYDERGKPIGVCNYMTNMVDSVCGQLSDCDVIYRCDKHISGEPPVNKLGLAE